MAKKKTEPKELSKSVLMKLPKGELVQLLKDSRDHYAKNAAQWQSMVESRKDGMAKMREQMAEMRVENRQITERFEDAQRTNETLLKIMELLVRRVPLEQT